MSVAPNDVPLLQYDSERTAMLEPSKVIRAANVPECCVICFFREIIEEKALNAAVVARQVWEDGVHELYETAEYGQRLAFFHPGVGAPVAAGLLEDFIARGCRRFVACGGAGALVQLPPGHVVVPTSAVRDEGTSYHYLPAGAEVTPDPQLVESVLQVLARNEVPYLLGKTWTTDAPYRETRDKVALRRDEGCLTVEMEAAAFFAVARFRSVAFAQLLYAGDDLSSDEWDHRGWTRHEARARLFDLAARAVLFR